MGKNSSIDGIANCPNLTRTREGRSTFYSKTYTIRAEPPFFTVGAAQLPASRRQKAIFREFPEMTAKVQEERSS
jgi:hypothetical protein